MIHHLVIIVFFLTLMDVICTVVGIKVGIVEEANPIFKGLMNAYPIVTGIMVFIFLTVILVLVYKYGYISSLTLPMLWFVLLLKIAVAISHLYWIFFL
jgi:hypothetical protein